MVGNFRHRLVRSICYICVSLYGCGNSNCTISASSKSLPPSCAPLVASILIRSHRRNVDKIELSIDKKETWMTRSTQLSFLPQCPRRWKWWKWKRLMKVRLLDMSQPSRNSVLFSMIRVSPVKICACPKSVVSTCKKRQPRVCTLETRPNISSQILHF